MSILWSSQHPVLRAGHGDSRSPVGHLPALFYRLHVGFHFPKCGLNRSLDRERPRYRKARVTASPVVNDRAGPAPGSHASSPNPAPAMGRYLAGSLEGNGCQQCHLLAALGTALQVMGGAEVSQELNPNLFFSRHRAPLFL